MDKVDGQKDGDRKDSKTRHIRFLGRTGVIVPQWGSVPSHDGANGGRPVQRILFSSSKVY
jgi:hypothetical protein